MPLNIVIVSKGMFQNLCDVNCFYKMILFAMHRKVSQIDLYIFPSNTYIYGLSNAIKEIEI